jgi:hypothetical protein
MTRSKAKVLDPTSLISEIVSSGFDLSKFRQIDETGILQPANFYEWTVGRDFCNQTILPWQVEAGMKLFSDYCPKCTNPEYITDLFDETSAELQDNIQFLERGICPKCHKNRLELFTLGQMNPSMPSIKNEFIACCGQRSGKSKAAAIYTSYQTQQWLGLADPLDFYGLSRLDCLVGTFAAITADQAERNLWIPFRGLYDKAPWFEKYNAFLREESKRLSVPLVEVKDTFIFYVHKPLLIQYTGSEDSTKRGATRLFGVIDEIGFFNSETNAGSRKKIKDADKNYTALNNSLSTLRQKALKKMQQGHYNVPTALMHNASSPSNALDKIMRLVKSSVANPWAVSVHKATWELNPDYSIDSCRSINPSITNVEFERDFGAIPPFSDMPFIGDARIMEKLCDQKLSKVIETTPKVFTDAMGDRYLYLEAKAMRIDKSTPRMLALDNGYKQNAFAAAVFRFDSVQNKPVLDFGVSLYPQPDIGLYIHFPMMFDHFIKELVKNYRIVQVFYDRWQSLDQIQRLREMKVDAQAHSLSYEKDFLPFRQQLISGNMILPPMEVKISDVKESQSPLSVTAANPITNLVWQALTVREVGRKIMKPMEGDDDLFRAFVLGGSRFLDEETKKKYATLGGVGNSMLTTVGTYTSSRGSKVVDSPQSTNRQPNRALLYARVRTSKR